MIRKPVVVTAVALVVALAVLFAALPAVAQGPRPWVPFAWQRHGCVGSWRTGDWTMFDAVAEKLGLTPEELFAELHEGKSLADIAEAQGVDLQTVYDSVKTTRIEATKAAIEQAVENGRLSREQADWLLQGLEQGFLPVGRGLGRRFGVKGTWPGRGLAPSPTPSVTPSSS